MSHIWCISIPALRGRAPCANVVNIRSVHIGDGPRVQIEGDPVDLLHSLRRVVGALVAISITVLERVRVSLVHQIAAINHLLRLANHRQFTSLRLILLTLSYLGEGWKFAPTESCHVG